MYSRILLIITLLSVQINLFGQDDYFVNQSKFIQKVNPSAFALNELNKVGVLYNSLKVNENTTMDNKYVFGSIAFPANNFALGFDVNSFQMGSPSFNINKASLNYVYILQLSNEVFMLPGISLGFGSESVNIDELVFYDQLDNTTGFINTESIDPIAPLISNTNYLDLGASILFHSEDFIGGLSIKHLNRPNVSFNKEVPFEKPIKFSLQGGYEFNINPYENRYLPRFSYLFTYGNFTKYGDAIYINLAQTFQLGEFSIGFVEQASSIDSFALNNIGLTLGLSVENFEFGINYNFPIQTINTVYSPSIFELSVIFDFSIYRRNNRGLYKFLQIDNYY